MTFDTHSGDEFIFDENDQAFGGGDDGTGVGDDILWDIVDEATREQVSGVDTNVDNPDDLFLDIVDSATDDPYAKGQKRGIGDDIIWDIVD